MIEKTEWDKLEATAFRLVLEIEKISADVHARTRVRPDRVVIGKKLAPLLMVLWKSNDFVFHHGYDWVDGPIGVIMNKMWVFVSCQDDDMIAVSRSGDCDSDASMQKAFFSDVDRVEPESDTCVYREHSRKTIPCEFCDQNGGKYPNWVGACNE